MKKEAALSMSYSDDPNAEERKKDHIELAFKSQVGKMQLDDRFYYEPLFSAHPAGSKALNSISFLGKKLQVPIWVSSMTGGTKLANQINHNLAKVCNDFGMGMGLGSCRSLLFSSEHLKDFAVRKTIGTDLPLYANLGIAQIEKLVEKRELYRITHLIEKLEADGLIIHINPFQEWLQPEGDIFQRPAIETIGNFLEQTNLRVIIKEVGQGMGYQSLKALFQLPLEAIDFGASGGTNFSLLELLRSSPEKQENYKKLVYLGHTAEEMVEMSNQIVEELGEKLLCKQLIISGGIKDFLDGYYLIEKSHLPAIYGQASGFLKHAKEDYDNLYEHVKMQVQGLQLAQSFLSIKS